MSSDPGLPPAPFAAISPRSPGRALLLTACWGAFVPLLSLWAFLSLHGGAAADVPALLAVTGGGTLVGLFVTLGIQGRLFGPSLRTFGDLEEHLLAERGTQLTPAAPGEGRPPMPSAEECLHRLVRLTAFQKDLLAVLSHDARSPLASIRFATEMSQTCLRDPTPDLEELREMNLIAREATQRQVQLLEHLFTIVRAEAGEIPVRRAAVGLDELLRGVAGRAAVRARAKGVELLVESPGARGVTVTLDAEMTGQVLDHLVYNAIRFTPAGGTVEVEATVRGDALELYVRDTGIGIPLERLVHLWQPVGRPEHPGADSPRVSNVGLWTCRLLTELQDGRLEVDTESGAGSSFRMTLPFPAPVRPDAYAGALGASPAADVPRDRVVAA